MGAMEPDDLEIKSAPYPEEKNLECGGWGVLSPKRYRDDSINTTYFNTIDSYSSLEWQLYRRSAVS